MTEPARKRLRKIIQSRPVSSNSEVCLVCMEYLSPDIPKGLLSCSHSSFCFDCIYDWSSIANKCPLCKSRFSEIRNSSTNEVVQVQDTDFLSTDPYTSVFDETYCRLCGSRENEDTMLLCDRCDKGFHTNCLHMQGIPNIDAWYCDTCVWMLNREQRKRIFDSMKDVGRTVEEIVEPEIKVRKRLKKLTENTSRSLYYK
jgi:hypothetical protein